MNGEYGHPISQEDLLFTAEMALREANKVRPEKGVCGDRDRLKPAAPAMVALIELRGTKRSGKSPGRGPIAVSSGVAGRGG